MDITSFIIIGAIVSLVVQYLKNKLGTNSNGTLLAVMVISIASGSVYYFIKDTTLWQPILQILAFAGAIYTYILKRFE
jgi:hypothetical protein